MIYELQSIPATIEEFQRLHQDLRKSPEGAVSACILALKLMADDLDTGTEAMKMLDPDISKSRLSLAKRQLNKSSYMMHSYFLGTTHEDNYRLPDEYKFEFTTNRYSGDPSEGSVKLFTTCSGAASPRPVTVKRRASGEWYPHEWSSLIVGIVEGISIS